MKCDARGGLCRYPGLPERRISGSYIKSSLNYLSLEAKMLKMSLSYFGHIIRRPDSLEKTTMLGKVEGSRNKKLSKAPKDRTFSRALIHRIT